MKRFVFFHGKKCKRMEGGRCHWCILGSEEKKYEYKWIGTTGKVEDWGDRAGDMFGKFDKKEVLHEYATVR